MGTESKIKTLRRIQFGGSVVVVALYLFLATLPFLQTSDMLSWVQIAMGFVAVLIGGIPFANAFDPERKKFCCVALVYLLIMAVFGFLAYIAYLPILQSAGASGVVSMAATLTHWVNVVSLVAFLSIFVVTAADSGFIQDQLAKPKK